MTQLFTTDETFRLHPHVHGYFWKQDFSFKKKKNLSTRAVLKKKKKNLRPHVDAKNEMLANQKPRSLGGKK